MDENLSTVNAGQEVNVEPQNVQDTGASTTTQIDSAPATQKPVQSTEDNARFAAIRREAEQKAKDKARDELIDEMYGQSHNIHTYADYQKAVEAQKRQEEIERLVQQNIPQEYAEKLMKVDEIERELQQEKQTKAQQERQRKQYAEFLEAYPDVNPEEIPADVWKSVKSGASLLDAYTRHENKGLKDELSKYRQQQQAQQQADVTNQINAKSSPGSLTGNGSPKEDVISFETYEANKHDQAWVNKNFNKIMKSRATW